METLVSNPKDVGVDMESEQRKAGILYIYL